MQESKTLHYILGISLVMIAVFVVASLVMINSQADNNAANTQVVINDDPPTLLNLKLANAASGGTGIGAGNDTTWASSGVTLTSGTVMSVFANGMITDPNGNADMADVDARLWRASDAAKTGSDAGSTCTSSAGAGGITNNHCFYQTTCSLDTNAPGNGTNQKRFSCQFTLPFYTAGTGTGAEFDAATTSSDDYKVEILVTSGGGSPYVTTLSGNFDTDASGSGGTGDVRRINTLTSLSIPSALIDYGNLGIGGSLAGGATKLVSISQAGNDEADVYAYAAGNLGCSVLGSIVGDLQKISLNSGDNYASGTTLPLASSSTTTPANLVIGYKPDAATAVSDDLFFNIQVPVGVAGTCTGLVNMITYAK